MSDGDARVSIEEPCVAGAVLNNVTATTPWVYPVCNGAQFQGSGPASGFGIRVGRVDAAVATLHVVFHIKNPDHSTDDAFLVLPSDPDRRGSHYWALGHQGACQGTPPCYDTRWLASASIATDITFQTCAGASDTKSLGAGQVFQQVCDTTTTELHGTGYTITGTANFGLLSGATLAFVPAQVNSADVLAEMLPPTSWLGTEHFVTEFAKGSSPLVPGDLVRILSTADNNRVTITVVGSFAPEPASGHACSSSTPVLNAGQWCDFLAVGGARITSDHPISVGHFMKGYFHTGIGDPSFMIVVPTSKLRCGVPFYAFDGFDTVSPNGSFVNIVAPTSEIASVLLDGAVLSAGTTCGGYSPVAFGTSGYSWTRCRLPSPTAGQHRVDSGSTPVAVYVYGTISQGSYAYPAGMAF